MERYTVFDLEMPNRSGDRISAIGICVIENGEIVEEYYSLVNPKCKFDRYTIKITGITPELVANERTFPEVWEEIKDLFDDTVLVAHSVQGDMYVLSRCLQSYGIEWRNSAECACTLELGNLCYPDLVSHRLDAMCETLGIELDHHNAGSDARGAAELLLNYMKNGVEPSEHILIFDTIKARAVHPPKKPFPQAVAKEIREELCDLRDEECRLIKLSQLKELSEDEIIGVSKSVVIQYSEKLLHTAKANEFVRILPHRFLEENDLHALLINDRKKYTSVMDQVKTFLPYINNPETCSMLAPKAFAKHPPELLKEVYRWMDSYRPYTVRFAVETLIRFYMTDAFRKEMPGKVASLDCSSRIVGDIIPSYFAAGLSKQYETFLPWFEQRLLVPDIHNKAIMKYLSDEKAQKNRKLFVKNLLI